MPSYDFYKQMLGVSTIGEARKQESDIIIEATWDSDIDTKTCYFYDYEHDTHRLQLRDLHPEDDAQKIPMRVKYIRHTSQNMEKDTVTYHLQLRPSQTCVVPYYKQNFIDRVNSVFPCGLYVDIPDNKGKYNRWLIVSKADYYDSQFSTFEILPCDYVLQWVSFFRTHSMACVTRSQASYTNGLKQATQTISLSDVQKVILPFNNVSEEVWFDKRMIIDNKVDIYRGIEPLVWKVSKINRIGENGLITLTFIQDKYDETHDYIEYSDLATHNPSSIVGMWANYYTVGKIDATPDSKTPPTDEKISSVITCSGSNPLIKVGGSYKKLTVSFYQKGAEITPLSSIWTYIIDGKDVSNMLDVIDSQKDPTLNTNQVKVKFKGDTKYIGKVLLIVNTSHDVVSQFKMTVAGL